MLQFTFTIFNDEIEQDELKNIFREFTERYFYGEFDEEDKDERGLPTYHMDGDPYSDDEGWECDMRCIDDDIL